jgi:Bacterial archaeo-eukaryotic release factor family 10
MGTKARILTLPKALELLRITTPPAPVLSAYLTTTPSRVQGDGYLIAYRTACAELTTLLRKHPFDRLFIAGPDEAVAMLRHQLPRILRARLAGALELELFAGETDILHAARSAAEAIERQEEADAIDELLDAVT